MILGKVVSKKLAVSYLVRENVNFDSRVILVLVDCSTYPLILDNICDEISLSSKTEFVLALNSKVLRLGFFV